MYKRSEKIHSKYDLTISGANHAAKKTAKYAIKSAKMEQKSLKTDNAKKADKYHVKAEKFSYKSANAKITANTLSKTTGYTGLSMHYSIKSDRFAKKAAKTRYKIAKNERYINTMNRKVSSLTGDDAAKAKAYIAKLQ